MKNKIFTILLLLSFGAFSFKASANYNVSPVNLELSKKMTKTKLTIENKGDSKAKFQVRVMKAVMHGTETTYVESDDLMVKPAMFELKAGKSQLIRVATGKMTSGDKYYISVKELPAPNKEPKGNSVQLVTDFRVPVTVAHE